MGFPTYVRMIVCYIESHIRDGKIQYEELEKAIGFSQSYIREIFKRHTGCSLARYIRRRKIYVSTFDLLHSSLSILEIALLYGFANPESYTRAFQKVMGISPSRFRREHPLVGKKELMTGVYSVGPIAGKERQSEIPMKEKNYKDNESTILFGVPRVGYGTYGGCTPYPICVKACSDYLGEDIEYFYFMVSCGAAFRLTWNCREWDLGNVDIYKSFPDPEGGYAYQLGAEALGREFYIQGRDSQTQKEDFIKFIKQHIDEGYPCVALGIIGPPEACIITGYKKQGEVLLGWNFFQNDEDFAADIKIEENGYFSNDTWWENSDTHAVMCIGPIKKERLGTKTILENAVRVMTGRREGDYYKGIAAYDAWKKMLGDPNEFHTGDMYSVFFPKYLCHSDAMNSLLDGRKNAARYFKYLSETEPEKKEEYLKLANQFHKTWKLSLDMQKVFEGAGMNETLKKFVDADVRKKGCDYIEKLRQSDKKCLQHLTELLNSL